MTYRQVQATIAEGYRVASGTSTIDPMFNDDGGTVGLQIPHFIKLGLDFDGYFGKGNYFVGTLDMDFAPKRVQILKPAYYFEKVRWTHKFDKPDQPPFLENFYLDEASVLYNGQRYKALLYIPDPVTKPGHFQLPTVIEVIAQPIPNIGYGSQATLEYDDAAITLID